MKGVAALLLLLITGCGGLTETEDGVVFLEVIRPPSTTLIVGATLQLEARALDARGDPVDAEVRWASADPFLAVEELTGLVTALDVGTGGRLQARTGSGSRTLYSDPITLTVIEPAAAPRSPVSR